MQKNETRGLNFCTTNSLLTATGAETVHDSTVLLNYAINGKAYTKSGTNADQVTPTVDAVTGAAITLTASKLRVVVWCYNSSAVVKAVASEIVDWDGTNANPMPQFPAIPDDLCPFAYQVLKAGSTLVGTATFGSTNWNAAGFTNAIVNVLTLPDRPQIA